VEVAQGFGLSLLEVVVGLISLYWWVILVRALLSWVSPDPYNPIVRTIYNLTEPVFDWFRERLPVVFGGIDFSPLLVLLVIEFVQAWLLPNVYVMLTNFA